MHSPEGGTFQSNGTGDQFDFFEALDNTVPNEDLHKIQLDAHREVAYDPKDRFSFLIFDYMGQTTATVSFNENGALVSLDVERMGGESGQVESVWKKKHEEAATKFIAENALLLGLRSH